MNEAQHETMADNVVAEAKAHDFSAAGAGLNPALKMILERALKVVGPLLLDALQRWLDAHRAKLSEQPQ